MPSWLSSLRYQKRGRARQGGRGLFCRLLGLGRPLALCSVMVVGLTGGAGPSQAQSLYDPGLSLEFMRDSSFADEINIDAGWRQEDAGTAALFVGGNLRTVAEKDFFSINPDARGAMRLSDANGIVGVDVLLDAASNLQAGLAVGYRDGETTLGAKLRYARDDVAMGKQYRLRLRGELDRFTNGENSVRAGENGLRAAVRGDLNVFGLAGVGSSFRLEGRLLREFGKDANRFTYSVDGGIAPQRMEYLLKAQWRSFFAKRRGELFASAQFDQTGRRQARADLSYRVIDRQNVSARAKLTGRLNRTEFSDTSFVQGGVLGRYQINDDSYVDIEPFYKRFTATHEQVYGLEGLFSTALSPELSLTLDGRAERSSLTGDLLAGGINLDLLHGNWSARAGAEWTRDLIGTQRTLSAELAYRRFFFNGRTVEFSVLAERDDDDVGFLENRIIATARMDF